ncbi:Large-conductance mechanosensitive channel [Lentibacillus sp. JNUCC-1]|uniref:large conductance mechanosensitive channel protein MscL n=1 Tax=Lentibacillus sp. JNUCC-1 TaxID=2654513 RepID=UPI0012E86118|nr:large conductance mechanosensitive channel protein MscL [Lentibacillus sp. JNUCC-1]MUV38236.1 Large-conductance mechanosensitive channel [Lentibacillus sp. JNUCC-1]
MGLFKEFRQFAIRGSAVDMGVGIVLGAAFSGLIDSLVRDLLLPPLGLLYSKINVQDMYISLSGGVFPSLEKAKEAGAVTINYGLFMMAAVRFIIILFAVFVVVRQINRWKNPHQTPIDSMTKKQCPYCCTPIPSKAVICPNCSSELQKEEPRYNSAPKWRIK